MFLSDVIRLLAVPVFAWVAYSDYKTRRVPNQTWPPLAALGVALIALDVFTGRVGVAVNAAVAVAFLAALSKLLTQLGEWGGADTQAYLVIGLLFPVAPVGVAALSVFPATILLNSVLLSGVYLAGATAVHRDVPDSVPFLVPTFGGIVAAVAVGDILMALFL